jgi:hypothetical protein
MRIRPKDPIVREAVASGVLLLAFVGLVVLGIVGQVIAISR